MAGTCLERWKQSAAPLGPQIEGGTCNSLLFAADTPVSMSNVSRASSAYTRGETKELQVLLPSGEASGTTEGKSGSLERL